MKNKHKAAAEEKKIGISRLETKELRVTDEFLTAFQKTASRATPLQATTRIPRALTKIWKDHFKLYTHTTQQHLTAILLTALPTVYIRGWRHSAYSCLYELWPRIGSNLEHKVRQPLQRLRIFSENNNRGKKRLFTCLCNGTPIQVQLQPPKQAQFLFSHHIGQPHSPHWRCYTHSKHWLLCWRKKILNQGRRLNKFPSVQ